MINNTATNAVQEVAGDIADTFSAQWGLTTLELLTIFLLWQVK